MHTESSRRLARKIMGLKKFDPQVVHHIDGNPFNNNLKNLKIIESQSEHLRLHKKGIKLTEEHKRKLGESKKGSKNPMFGVKPPNYKGGIIKVPYTTKDGIRKIYHYDKKECVSYVSKNKL